MVKLDAAHIRNVAIVAHSGAGKTSLSESMLFNAGAIDRTGTVEAGNTTMDFEAEEIDRKISVSSAVAFCDWKDTRFNLIDTPGFINFIEDTRGCLRVADGAIVIVSAISGVKAETEKIWKYACEFEVPRIVFVSKLDKEAADFSNAISELEKSFEQEAIPLYIPVGSGDNFKGIVDLIAMKAHLYQEGQGGKTSETEIPDDLKSTAEEYRKKLIEKIAEADDSLLEKYLEGGELTPDEILKGIKEASLTRRFIPVVCGSATLNIGVLQLMDVMLMCLPTPEEMSRISPIRGINPKDGKEVDRKPATTDPLTAYVFKTIADPFAGKLSIFRVYSGILRADSTVLNASSGTKERIGQVFYLIGKKRSSSLRIRMLAILFVRSTILLFCQR
jgi:elongation factor G